LAITVSAFAATFTAGGKFAAAAKTKKALRFRGAPFLKTSGDNSARTLA
jgi:hypothetical protein